MALPSSGPISMSMVHNEFTPGTALSNISLFSYGDTYLCLDDNIRLATDFYGKALLTSFSYNPSNQNTFSLACAQSANYPSTAYHNGNSSYPVAGNIVHTDYCGTALSDGYYRIGNGDAMEIFTSGGVGGIVKGTSNCK